MPKNKKKKQNDFQKIKLKVGKKLKKGENVTDASFKSRTIQITQQLKSETGAGPSTKKKQNIRDVLVQCRHYNSNVRLEAVTGLREIVTVYPEVITTHLSDILEKSSELLSDKEPSVRQACLRLFKAVFPKTPEKQIKPFFPMVCAHLCCAMTHIYTDIQMDSLTMFDLLLVNYPVLMISHSNQVLVNFIEQISRQKGSQRSLSTNLGQKVTSMKWRTSVLGRIEVFLMAYLECQRDKQPVDICTTNVVWFDEHCPNHIVVHPSYIQEQWENPGFTLRSIHDTEEIQEGLEGRFPEFVDTLIPLLLECWVEAAPGTVKAESALKNQSTVVLSNILNVTKLLLECVDTLFVQKGSKKIQKVKSLTDFLHRLFSWFPYSVQEYRGFKGRQTDNQTEVGSVAVLNLTICEILMFCLSHLNRRRDISRHWLTDAVNFTTDFLNMKESCVGANCTTVVHIARKLMTMDEQMDLEEMVSGMYKRFKRAGSMTKEKKVYLEFFSDVVLDSGNSNKISEEICHKFLEYLPGLFPVAAKDGPKMVALLLHSLKMAASRGSLSFLDAGFFSTNGDKWFGVNDGAVLQLSIEHQRELFSLLYFVPEINGNTIGLFTQLARCEKVPDKNVAYLIQVLHNRFLRGSQTESECSLHISFLTSLLKGNTEDLPYHTMDSSSMQCVDKFIVIEGDQGSWSRHAFLVQEVIKVLHTFENSLQVKNIVQSIVHKYLVNHTTLSSKASLGICWLTSQCSEIQENFKDNNAGLGLATIASCINCCEEGTREIVGSLQNAVCRMLAAVPAIFKKFLSRMQAVLKDSTEPNVILLLRVCLIILGEEYRLNLLKNTEAVDILIQILETVKNMKHKSQEAETLIADLEYRCTTQSFTVT